MANHLVEADLTDPVGGSGEERRTAQRYASDQLAECRAMPGVDAISVHVKDISVHGLGLLSPRRFERGTMLIVEIRLAGSESVSAFARVVRLTLQGGGQWHVGCAFFEPMNTADVAAFRAPACGKNAEQRASVRVPDPTIAICQRASVGSLGTWAAEVVDRSDAGMRLLLSLPVAVGAQLKVTLPSQALRPAFTVAVQVVRQDPQGDGKWLIACETCRPSAKEKAGTPSVAPTKP